MELRKLLLFAFMISGMSALIYEVVWARQLQLIFGSTIYAVSTILTTFFVGFAFGAFIIRNYADRTENPLKIFGLLQLGIGLYGLIILWLFKFLTLVYLPLIKIQGAQFVQFTIILLVLIIPTTLFGAIWPVISKNYINLNLLGEDTGKLYSFNSFGAGIGSVLAGFVLIPLLGIRMTSIFVACLNIIIAVIIFVKIKREKNKQK